MKKKKNNQKYAHTHTLVNKRNWIERDRKKSLDIEIRIKWTFRIQFEIGCSCLWLSDCGFSSHAIFSLLPLLLLLLSFVIRRLFVAAHRFSVYWKCAQNWQQTHICRSNEWKCFNYTWNRTHTFPTHIQQVCFMFDASVAALHSFSFNLTCVQFISTRNLTHKIISQLDWPHEFFFNFVSTHLKHRLNIGALCVARQNGEIDRSQLSNTHTHTRHFNKESIKPSSVSLSAKQHKSKQTQFTYTQPNAWFTWWWNNERSIFIAV